MVTRTRHCCQAARGRAWAAAGGVAAGAGCWPPRRARYRAWVYKLINTALAAAGLKDATGKPLVYRPHDFRRCFTTDAVTGGLPVHIAARLLGYKRLTTTETYMAVFQEDLIRSYRAFLDTRRATRPAGEYREPTDQEWQEFQRHFQMRKVALGTCGRP